MSAESRVGFCQSCLTVAVLKVAGIWPEVREELIGVMRNGKMSCEMFWRGEEGIGSREQVVAR